MIGHTVGDTLERMTVEPESTYEPHIGTTRQYWRDMVLGVNDGLVSMLLLVAGVVGGGLDAGQVLLTGIAGGIAGAVSMAAGEYLATKSQDEVLKSELTLERTHIRDHRQIELDQLREMFADMGIAESDLDGIVEAFNRSDDALLNAMAALEFGVVETERRSPIRAMLFSGVLFLAGALPSVLPFALTTDTSVGLLWAAVFAFIGLFIVGAAKTKVTRGNPFLAGGENVAIAGLGGLIAYLVGALVGTSLA
jgi:vacuolar iron transporter family protein